jgi:hypothetical protein
MERDSRRTSLRLSGEIGPFKAGDDFRKTVVDLAKEIGVDVDLVDVDRAPLVKPAINS